MLQRAWFASIVALALVFAATPAPASKAVAPSISLEQLKVIHGRRDRAQIRQEVIAYYGWVRMCFEKAAATSNRWLHGHLALSYVIGPDGAARDGRIVSATIGSDEGAACILNVMVKHRYSAAQGDSTVVQRWRMYFPDGRGGVRKGPVRPRRR